MFWNKKLKALEAENQVLREENINLFYKVQDQNKLLTEWETYSVNLVQKAYILESELKKLLETLTKVDGMQSIVPLTDENQIEKNIQLYNDSFVESWDIIKKAKGKDNKK
jgi:hypothetical protein